MEEVELENTAPDEFVQPPAKKARLRCRVCKICSALLVQSKMKNVQQENQRLVVMIEQLLNGRMLLKDAHEFMSEKNRYICRTHFGEIYSELCRHLQIPSFDSIARAPQAQFHRVMTVANSIDPGISPHIVIVSLRNFYSLNRIDIEVAPPIYQETVDRLLDEFSALNQIQTGSSSLFALEALLQRPTETAVSSPTEGRGFWQKEPTEIENTNDDRLEAEEMKKAEQPPPSTTGIPSIYIQNEPVKESEIYPGSIAAIEEPVNSLEPKHCSICHASSDLIEVQSPVHKLIIVVGCVLCAMFQVDRGTRLLQSHQFHVCSNHLPRAAHQIRRYLGSPHSLGRQDRIAIDCLMITVKSFTHSFDVRKFREIFGEFSETYKHILNPIHVAAQPYRFE